jgi:hypothetical protein
MVAMPIIDPRTTFSTMSSNAFALNPLFDQFGVRYPTVTVWEWITDCRLVLQNQRAAVQDNNAAATVSSGVAASLPQPRNMLVCRQQGHLKGV